MAAKSMGLVQELRMKPVIAPQMRESLKVLQVPVQQLNILATRELEQNPTLEELDKEEISIDEERENFEAENEGSTPADEMDETQEKNADSPDSGETDGDEQPEPEPQTDFASLAQEHADYFFQDGGNNEYNPDYEERRQFMFDSITVEDTLQEHLLKQLELSELEDVDILIAEQLIGSISDDGYLRTPLADIAQVIPGVDMERCESVLRVVQSFDPPGIGARDLRECLLLQIRNSHLEGSLAETIVLEHLDLIEKNKISMVAKECGVSRKEVEQAIRELSNLDPRPGAKFDIEYNTYVVPEVEVRKENGTYKVFIEDAYIPRLRISRRYLDMLKSPDITDEAREYVQEKIRSGMNFIKSINDRQDTIRRVSQKIVDAQQEFFDNGVAALRPMVMEDIAKETGMDPSTISRTVSNKYMISPQGIHELKFFFTGGIPTDSGVDISTRHVKSIIKQMIDEEDPLNPLADQDIERNLASSGINIARRTIAKYRNTMKIPPSHMRKRE